MSNLEETFALQILALKLEPPHREYKFIKGRKFRFDFAWPDKKIAVEIDGGTFSCGRHTRGVGFRNDCIKFNLAMLDGWRVFRGDSYMVIQGDLIETVGLALGSEPLLVVEK